jgi:hypothetical protein
VTQQEPVEGYDSNGKPTTTWHVGFKTGSGTESHVKVPASEYSAENVHAAITHQATEIEKVNNMTSEGPRPAPPAA